MTFVLTRRDVALLDFLALHRGCSLEQLAERFFGENPFTGERNRNPLRACERRIAMLRANGFVRTRRIRRDDGRRCALVSCGPASGRLVGDGAARRRIPLRDEPHHVHTMDAINQVERDVEKKGGRLVSFRVESAIRSEALRGRLTTRGDRFAAFPDAVCTVELPDSDGNKRVLDVAVEYVTGKYTSADIAEKRASFAKTYHAALWFADRPGTAARVKRITGAPCSLLT